jgi:4-amino-4-deoxy-L-arabinose transferase-like glycosyltransferase
MSRHLSLERAPAAVLAAIILAYLVLGVLYATLTPPWQVPDEPAHYNYVRYLVEERRLPVLRAGDYDQAYLEEIKHEKFSPQYPIDAIRYEFHQPPLYYLLLAPVYALSGGALVPMRLVSALLGAAVLLLAYLVGRALYPDKAWPALGTTAFIAFVPQHIAMTAGVENDVLAELLLGLVLLRLIRWLRSEAPYASRQHVKTGLVIGLGLLTKTTAYVAVPLAVIAVGLKFYRRTSTGKARLDARSAVSVLLALLLPALLVGLPWFVRNVAVYEGFDPTGLRNHNAIVATAGQPRSSEFLERLGWWGLLGDFSRTTFRSFWAQFGWMAVPIDWRIYLALRTISVVAAIGFVFRAVEAWEERRWPSTPLLLLLCSGLLTLGTYLGYNLTFYQAQGRYLYPALIPLGLAWTLGLQESLQPKNVPWTGGLLAAVTAYDTFQVFVGGCGDKWNILIHGLSTAFYGARWLLKERLDAWFLALPYGFLAALCAVSPWWFILPYLTPQ